MSSITGLSNATLLAQAIQYAADELTACGFEVCSLQRTHTEPRRLRCCDCEGADGARYTINGWIIRAFSADGRLNEVSSLDCPTIDALSLGFTVARCWPEIDNPPLLGGAMDATAAELALVLDCLQDAFGRCEANPSLFRVVDPEAVNPPPMLCTKMVVSSFHSERSQEVTPYGDQGGTVTTYCAGWKWSVVIA